MSVSDALVYAPKPSAVSGSKYRQNLPSYNKSTFNPGETVMLNIPCGRRGQFLNQRQSYLKFKVTNTGTVLNANATPATVNEKWAPDYTASSFISRLELFHGSNLLEQIHDYGLLYQLWMDMVADDSATQYTGTVVEGIAVSANPRVGADIDGQVSRVFCVPILSGLVGVLQSKFLPTGDMVGGDLRLELTLANAADAVTSTVATASKWTVSDVELMLEYVELNSEAARMISAQNSGGYMISFDTFANFASTVEGGATNMNVLIPARYSSLKTLFTVLRKQSNMGLLAAKTLTDRVNPFGNAGQWYYSIGGKNVPTTPVKTNSEAFAEMQKALHSLGAVSATSLINYTSWTASDAGTYIIAADLETLAHKSKLTESGVNTLTTNTHLIGQFGAALAATSPLHVATFAHYDAILIIQNGVASVQF